MSEKTFFTGKNIAIIAVIAVILILVIVFVSSYNSLATMREETEEKFSTIDVQLKRRADLIPNLVSTVKGYAAHETEAIEAVTDARTKYGSATTDAEKIQAGDELSGAISRLLVIAEAYPDLKADANFRQLSDELAGTENRIAVARKDYNEAVKEYNSKIIKFPSNMIAGMFGFEKAVYFEASETDKEVPTVDFND